MIDILHGDCRDILAAMPPAIIDSCVTDPPYHLTNNTGKGGFMGRAWDGGSIAFQPETWAAVLRVLKPGAHLLAFGGTRTAHRMTCAIEDAGFEIRDTLCWLYGSGFPKSLNIGNGWGTALKPAYEPIILARKPLIGTVAANVLTHGTGGLNIDVCRIGTTKRVPGSLSKTPNNIYGAGLGGYAQDGTESGHDPNVGRWPANVVHDGSPEVEAAFAAFGERTSGVQTAPFGTGGIWSGESNSPCGPQYGDSGSASRFFYTAKADRADRADSKHPTVKPIALLRWLVRLVTPPGGTVLDPFAGSGTTGEAAMREGCNAILIEREAEHVADIRHRVKRWHGGDLPLFAEVAAQ
jgi:site-specific DNA-methyltransferase (adenine-specific)